MVADAARSRTRRPAATTVADLSVLVDRLLTENRDLKRQAARLQGQAGAGISVAALQRLARKAARATHTSAPSKTRRRRSAQAAAQTAMRRRHGFDAPLPPVEPGSEDDTLG